MHYLNSNELLGGECGEMIFEQDDWSVAKSCSKIMEIFICVIFKNVNIFINCESNFIFMNW